MRAAFAREHGGPDVVEVGDLPDPVPGPEQVLVRVDTAGVGPWDVGVLSGAFPVDVPMPLVPGGETVGEVVAVGDRVGGGGPAVGDRVMTMGFHGALAELVAVDARAVGPAPASLGAVEAASLPVDASTAHLALETLDVGAGTTLLVTGAGSLVGHFAVQIAAGRGARVLATAGPRNAERLRRLGAAAIVDYHDDWVAALREHAPVDVVLDVVGGGSLEAALALVADAGRVVSVVGGADADPPRGISVTMQHTTGDRVRLTQVADLVEAGALQPLVAETLPLERAAEALRRVAEGHEPGKVVVRVAG